MTKLQLFVVSVLTAVITVSESKSYDGYKLITVTPQSKHNLNILQSIEHETNLNFLDSVPSTIGRPHRIVASPEEFTHLERVFLMNNIQYDVTVSNVGSWLTNQKIRGLRDKSTFHTIDFQHYWNFTEVTDYLYEIHEHYPEIVELEVVGQTFEGRDIIAAKISKYGKVDGSRSIVFIEGGLHAIEWFGVMAPIHLIHSLVEHSEDMDEFLDAQDWIIIPVVNADGFSYTHDTDRFWRKTRSVIEGSECLGVDPNRNFDFNWDLGLATSDDPCHHLFRGPFANSEIEVRLLSEYVAEYKSIELYLASHIVGPAFLYPYGYDFVVPDNIDEYHEVGERARQAILAINGTNYPVIPAIEFSRVSGTGMDFMSRIVDIPIVYTIEWTWPEPEQLEITLEESFAAFREFAIFIREKNQIESN